MQQRRSLQPEAATRAAPEVISLVSDDEEDEVRCPAHAAAVTRLQLPSQCCHRLTAWPFSRCQPPPRRAKRDARPASPPPAPAAAAEDAAAAQASELRALRARVVHAERARDAAEASAAAAVADAADARAAAGAAAATSRDQAAQCVICMDAPRCVALMPCRHFVLCDNADCAKTLGNPRKCPMCRKAVKKLLSLYIRCSAVAAGVMRDERKRKVRTAYARMALVRRECVCCT
jgi:hypothetical protein